MKSFLSVIIVCLLSLSLAAQNQADTYIKEAQTFLANKQYKDAQLSLQDAVNQINLLIAEQVVAAMPDEINGLKAETGNQSSTTGMFGGGIQISKSYNNTTDEGNDADVNIIANSPMLTAMSMYISNPTMLGPDYKSVRIGTQRAILKSEMDGDNRSTEIQIPLSTTLITIEMKGFASEPAELDFVNKLGIDKVKVALGE